MIYLLLVVYQLKHFLADYPLQNKFMLGKFLPWPKFVLPLLSHGAVHAVFTFLIALYFQPWYNALILAILDMTVHCVVDWIKANPSIGGRFKPLTKETYPAATDDQKLSNTLFWWALGADQMAHHLTHYFLIWMMLS